jgi:hypothetical protein
MPALLCQFGQGQDCRAAAMGVGNLRFSGRSRGPVLKSRLRHWVSRLARVISRLGVTGYFRLTGRHADEIWPALARMTAVFTKFPV